MRGHVAIITKPSPHYVLTKSTISGRDVVLLPGLLPIFLHGCEIKSGCLGTRLGFEVEPKHIRGTKGHSVLWKRPSENPDVRTWSHCILYLALGLTLVAVSLAISSSL